MLYLLPLDATQLGMLSEAELARYRGLQALPPNPAMADPDPARSQNIPRNEEEFLAAYENRLKDIRRASTITTAAVSTSFPPTRQTARTSPFAQPSRSRAQFSAMKEFRGISSRFPSRIT